MPETEPETPAEAARRVHADGFAALTGCCMGEEEVVAARAQVLRRYEGFLAQAAAREMDLARAENAERLAGFYVREGGRVDMQLWAAAVQTRAVDADAVEPVDAAPLLQLAQSWRPVLAALFAAHEPDGDGDDGFALEYVGCVLSRPGDGDQNWHLDGVHRNLSRHEPADRVNVFVPLVDIDESTGGTEMKRGSHVRSKGGGEAARFEAYEHLESVTHLVAAGTPVVMDYRVWHRGLANSSADTIRPLLYFKYALRPSSANSTGKRAPAGDGGGGKKRKRIALVPVPV